jgi:pimeloyl-ACP methyl ester carboxylesterase
MYTNPYEHLSGELTASKLIKAGFEEKSCDTGEVTLNYVVGPNNGPALLLIPAQMGTWESYKKVLVPLSKTFQVYALDIRGHGKSSWTPGNYSWKVIGQDMEIFINQVVQRKVFIAGNSSGGLITLWCAANLPDRVLGIILEDTPVFSAEMPRFKERDRFVYKGLQSLVEKIGNVHNRDLAEYFRGLELPVSDKKTKRMPDWFVEWLSKRIKKVEQRHPGRPIEVGYMERLNLLVKSLSMFDPDFARAFVDGRFYEGLNHAEALRRVQCPVLLLHADWKRYEQYGLVGAMDDDDARRVSEFASQTVYQKISANHVIHSFKPKQYIKAVKEFAETLLKLNQF